MQGRGAIPFLAAVGVVFHLSNSQSLARTSQFSFHSQIPVQRATIPTHYWCTRCRRWHPIQSIRVQSQQAPLPVPSRGTSFSDWAMPQFNRSPITPPDTLQQQARAPLFPLFDRVRRRLRGDDRMDQQLPGSNMCWCHAMSEFLEDRGVQLSPEEIMRRTGSHHMTRRRMSEQANFLQSFLNSFAMTVPAARSEEELKQWLSQGYGAIIRLRLPGGDHAVYLQRVSDDNRGFLLSDPIDGSTRVYTYQELLNRGYQETVLDRNNLQQTQELSQNSWALAR